MQYLNFSTCHSGNPDVYNLAYAFMILDNLKLENMMDGGKNQLDRQHSIYVEKIGMVIH